MRWKNIRNFSLMVDQMCKLVANAFDIFYSFVLAEWTDLRRAAERWQRSAKAGSIIRPGFALFSIRGIRVLYVWWPLCVSGTSYHRSRQPKLMYGMWNCGCSPAFFIYFFAGGGGGVGGLGDGVCRAECFTDRSRLLWKRIYICTVCS